jgi:hypothetical protein
MNEQCYIVVTIPSGLFDSLPCARLLESNWKPCKGTNMMARVDPTRPEMKQQRHVHLADKQHTGVKDKQVSWNQDTSRHDAASFDSNFKGIEKAKTIAREILGLPHDTVLEQCTGKFDMLVETVLNGDAPSDALIEGIYLKVRQGN